MIDTDPYPQLRAALAALVAEDPDHAGIQNRRGFNGRDTAFGHSLARQPRWSGRQAFALHRMMRQYAGQLSRLGIDYNTIPEPTVQLERHGEGGTRPQPREISFISETAHFRVRFPYDKTLVEAIKHVDGRRFEQETHSWLVPLAGAEGLEIFAAKHGFPITQKAQAALAEMALRRDASRATDAEIEIPGLVGELRPFQKAAVVYALRAKRLIIADEMGLGKTIEAIATIHAAHAYPALIVCPASLKANWAREIRKWLPGATVEITSGRAPTNPMFLGFTPDWTIANFDILAGRLTDLDSRGFVSIVFDEAHHLKERQAQRTQAALKLARGKQFRMLLSGTPILNRPKELITQLEIINQLENMGGWHDFNSRYVGAAGTTILAELNKRMRSVAFVRRLKKDVLKDLPDKQRTVVPLEIDNRKEYEFAKANLIRWLRDLEGDEAARRAQGAEKLVRIEKLKFLAAQGKLASARAWMTEFLESGAKLIAFADHIEIQKSLIRAFPGCAYVLGESNVGERQRQVDKFQSDPACPLIVCSIKAGGQGITLTAASNVAMLEYAWNPSLMAQCEDRAHRIGQKDSVTSWWLMSENTIDEWLCELIAAKAAVVDAATEGRQIDNFDILGQLTKRLLSD